MKPLLPAARDMSIRHWGVVLGLVAVTLGSAEVAQANDENVTTSHGYSYFGNLDYPADYPHLNYVNPDAPKGGEMSLAASGTFDSLNPYSRKGRSGALTTIQYDRLFESADDSVGQYYGVLAESLEYDEGRNYVIFNLRPEAMFWDGTPVTAEDVVYSHRLFIEQGLPSYAQAVGRMVTGAEALDDHTIRFTFNPEVTRRSLIETVGSTPVFSKAWFEADESRRLDEPRLEVAVGSGPYKLDSYDNNRRIVYKRRDDYWGKDLPFNVGRNNFDTIRVEYFADQTAAFEGFKAGEYTMRIESDPKLWATSYDFPKLTEGSVVRDEIKDGSPPTPSGFVFNLGKPQFADQNVRKASKMLDEAGWPVGEGNVRRNAEGQTLKVNIPYPSNLPTSTATMIETYVQNLQALGVDASAEKVDPAQYTLRSRERDYDMVYSTRYGSFLSTGGGLSQMYGSEEAAFSLFNPAGLASPLVDAIIEASFETDNQADQDAALMALDRALRYEFFVIPVGYIADYWTAYYDMYEYPENLPPYSLGHLDLWWINPEKEADLKAKGALR
jgi:ABC-type oligopeptide transport system substrate-binding subunit